MRALVIVDVQIDFCEGGSLAVAGGGEVARAISRHLEAGGYDYVIASRDFHINPGRHFSDHPDFVNSWPQHCVAGTGGADFHPDLVTSHIETVFSKGAHEAAYSAFDGRDEAGAPLAAWLRERGVDELDVAGIATDYCVRATTISAAREGFRARVLLSLTAGVDPTTTAESIDAMRAAGAQVTGTPVER